MRLLRAHQALGSLIAGSLGFVRSPRRDGAPGRAPQQALPGSARSNRLKCAQASCATPLLGEAWPWDQAGGALLMYL